MPCPLADRSPRASSSPRCCGASRPSGLVPAAALAAEPAQDRGYRPTAERPSSLKFAVLGDFGTGSREQYQIGRQMARARAAFPSSSCTTVGDNIYGSRAAAGLQEEVRDALQALLDAGVKFYASLGNHDEREQRDYKPFNMDGKTYYSFKAPKQDVRFFALDSTTSTPNRSRGSKRNSGIEEDWKIAYFHHPLYSSGDRHGSDIRPGGRARAAVREVQRQRRVHRPRPLLRARQAAEGDRLLRHGRGRPAAARQHRPEPASPRRASTRPGFLVAEINGDEMHFNAVSRAGQIIDSGVIPRRKQE